MRNDPIGSWVAKCDQSSHFAMPRSDSQRAANGPRALRFVPLLTPPAGQADPRNHAGFLLLVSNYRNAAAIPAIPAEAT